MAHATRSVRELREGPFRIAYAEPVTESLAREWSARLAEWFDPDRAPLRGAEAKPDLARISTSLGELVLKRERPRRWKRAATSIGARGFRSERAFRLGRALFLETAATPEPLACLLRRSPRSAAPCAWLVSHFVESEDPWTFLARRGAARKAELLEALAQTIAGLHARGFRHLDLKAPNLLVPTGARETSVLVTDLDGLRRVPGVPGTRVRDLGRLCMSFESSGARAAGIHADDWPTWVARYLELAPGGPPAEDVLEELVARSSYWARRRVERNLVLGRPIA